MKKQPEPDMVLHNGMTRVFGPKLTPEEFKVRDEALALAII